MKQFTILIALLLGLFLADSADAGWFRGVRVVAPGVNLQVGHNGFRGFRRARFRAFRFNTFGSRTVVDNFGNVFEVDAFGNARLRGSAFRGFSVQASPFVQFQSHGFSHFGSCR